MKSLKDKSWYRLTVSICIGVVLFVILSNISDVLAGIGTFLEYFSAVFLGAIIAYIVNPMAMFFRNKLFGKIKYERVKASLGNILAVIAVVVFLAFVIVLIVPQLIDSIRTFSDNFYSYIKKLQKTLELIGVTSSMVDLRELVKSSNEILDMVADYASKNIGTIMSTTVDVGKSVAQFFIALFLSVYFLAEKDKLKREGKRFLQAVCKGKYEDVAYVIKRSDKILNRYIVYNLVDSFIIGIVNAIFMTISDMPYVGLVSVIVGVMNIIPTFGPIVGAVFGGFLLLLVEPWYAFIFLVFTGVLQTVDGYILKPKLFGDSLGVSGLWILVGIVTGGRMFGVVGILLAIPMVAILEMLYHEFLLPFLENKNSAENGKAEEVQDSKEEA